MKGNEYNCKQLKFMYQRVPTVIEGIPKKRYRRQPGVHAGEAFTNVSKRRKDRYIDGSVMPDGDESIGGRRARSNWIRRR